MNQAATVLIHGIIDPAEPGCISAATVRDSLLSQYPFASITVSIDSDGGDYYEGFDIYTTLRGYGVPVTTTVASGACCASIATVILLAGDTRLVAPGPGRGMIHAPWGGIQGDTRAVMEYGELLAEVETELINFYNKNTRLDKVTLETLLRVDTELSGEQMVTMGFATALLTSQTPTPAPAQARRQIFARATIGTRPAPPTTHNTQTNEMKLTNLKRMAQAILNVIDGQPVKALILTTADGTQLTTNSAGDMPMADDAITMADGTPPADGSYIVTDEMGMALEITVVAGIITLVEENNEGEDVPLAQADADPETDLATRVAALEAALAVSNQRYDNLASRTAKVMAGLISADVPLGNEHKEFKPVSGKPSLSKEEQDRAAMLAERKARGQKK